MEGSCIWVVLCLVPLVICDDYIVNTVAGTGPSSRSTSSPTEMSLRQLVSIDFNATTQRLYVADFNRIWMIVGTTVSLVVAGTSMSNASANYVSAPGCCGDEGPALKASFTELRKIRADSRDGLWVLDSARLRYVSPLSVRTIHATSIVANGMPVLDFALDTATPGEDVLFVYVTNPNLQLLRLDLHSTAHPISTAAAPVMDLDALLANTTGSPHLTAMAASFGRVMLVTYDYTWSWLLVFLIDTDTLETATSQFERRTYLPYNPQLEFQSLNTVSAAFTLTGGLVIADSSAVFVMDLTTGDGFARLFASTPGFADGLRPFVLVNGVCDLVTTISTQQWNPSNVEGVLLADCHNGRVRSYDFATAVMRTLVGSAAGGYTGDGVAVENQLYAPGAMAFSAASGTLYFVDDLNGLLRALRPNGQLDTLAGVPGLVVSTGSVVPETIFGVPARAFYFAAHDIAVNVTESGEEVVYFLNDQYLGVIHNGYNRYLGSFNFTTDGIDDSNLDPTIGNFSFDTVGGVTLALDPLGQLYISDQQTVQAVVIQGQLGDPNFEAFDAHCVLGCPTKYWSNDTEVTYIVALRFDSRGNMLVFMNTATNIARIRKYDFHLGIYQTVRYCGQSISGATLDSDDNIYVTDAHANRVHRISADGSECALIAGNGIGDYTGDGGSALQATFAAPSGVAVGSGGRVFISDRLNSRIRVLGGPGSSSSSTNTALIVMVTVSVSLSFITAFLAYKFVQVRKQLSEAQHSASSGGYYQVKLLSKATFKGVNVATIEPHELKLQEQVGKGQFSEVCKALWHGGTVAVKSCSSQSVFLEVENEALINAHLGNHPNVVPFLGGFLPRRLMMFTFMAHGSMELVLIRQRQFPVWSPTTTLDVVRNWSVVAQMLMDAAAGVIHCHAKNIIHRDIAARNFLVDHLNRVTICDFGLARLLPPGELVGQSPLEVFALQWAAPEVLLERLLSEKSDVFAFGMFLYETVARTEPYPHFARRHPAEIAQAVVHGQHGQPPARPLVPGFCPAELAQLMARCWDARPDARPDMADVFETLSEFQKRYARAAIAGDLTVYRPHSGDSVSAVPSSAVSSEPDDAARYCTYQLPVQPFDPSQPASARPSAVHKRSHAGGGRNNNSNNNTSSATELMVHNGAETQLHAHYTRLQD